MSGFHYQNNAGLYPFIHVVSGKAEDPLFPLVLFSIESARIEFPGDLDTVRVLRSAADELEQIILGRQKREVAA